MGFFSYKRNVLGLSFCIVASLPLVLGLIFAGLYSKAKSDGSGLLKTSCLIESTYLQNATCNSCDGADRNDANCITYYYTCYNPCWEVIYVPERMKMNYTATNCLPSQTSSPTEAMNIAEKRAVGESYSCYYKITDYASIVWTVPDTKTPLIVMAVCLSVGGAMMIAVALYCILTKKRY